MPMKTSAQGRVFEIDGRRLTWHPEQFDGEPLIPDVVLPLRIKLRRLLEVTESEIFTSNEKMHQLLQLIAPAQVPSIVEMDVNDFQDMFMTWHTEYSTLTGASRGESQASPSS